MKELKQLSGGRGALMLDIDNLGRSAKDRYSAAPDYRKIKQLIGQHTDLVHASVYMHRRESAEKFVEMLMFAGYLVRQRERKTDVDTFLMYDALNLLPNVDVLVLGAGDGDYLPILWQARMHGTTTAIIAVNGSLSPDLRANADLTIPIDETLLYEHRETNSHDSMRVGL